MLTCQIFFKNELVKPGITFSREMLLSGYLAQTLTGTSRQIAMSLGVSWSSYVKRTLKSILEYSWNSNQNQNSRPIKQIILDFYDHDISLIKHYIAKVKLWNSKFLIIYLKGKLFVRFRDSPRYCYKASYIKTWN